MKKLLIIVALVAMAMFFVNFSHTYVYAGGPDPLTAAIQEITPPSSDVPDAVRAFFGKNGVWTGEAQHQGGKKGNASELLVVIFQEMSPNETSRVFTGVGGRYLSGTATFTKKDNGTVCVKVPYEKGNWTLWIKGDKLVGTLHTLDVTLSQK
jgi:hypothetical protein